MLEGDVGDVDDLRVGLGRGLRDELWLGRKAFDPGREGTERFAVGAVGGVDGDVGVRDLGATDVEQADAEPLVPGLEHGARGRRHDLLRGPDLGDEVVQGSLRLGERGGRGRVDGRVARVLGGLVASAGGKEGGAGGQGQGGRKPAGGGIQGSNHDGES